ncbi:MAG: glycosyltransferase [Acidobacteriota bacterium]
MAQHDNSHGPPRRLTFGFLDFAAGGAQELVLTACRHLDRGRFAPHLLCLRGRGRWLPRARRAELPVATLGRLEGSWDAAAVFHARRHLRRWRTEILHLPLYSRAFPYFRLAARLAGVPLVVAHELGRPTPPRRRRRWADAALNRGSRYLATSRFHRQELIAAGIDPASIAVVYSGIDPAPFAHLPARTARQGPLRRQYAIGERPVVLVPSRLHPMKGHVDLIAAHRRVQRKVPEIRLILAGDGPERSALEAAVAAAGCGDSIHFLGHRDDLPALLAEADVVCLPSHREGLPAALLEAYAAARPVVATAVGGVPEALTDGREGRLVPPRDPEALADALSELLRAPASGQACGAAGRRTLTERFTADRTTAALEAQYLAWWQEAQGER